MGWLHPAHNQIEVWLCSTGKDILTNIFKENVEFLKMMLDWDRTNGKLSCVWKPPKAWVQHWKWRLTLTQKKLELFMEWVEMKTQFHVNF